MTTHRRDLFRFAAEAGGGPAPGAAPAAPAAPAPAPGAPAAPGAAPSPGAPPAAANGADLAWLPEGYRANPLFGRMKGVEDLAREHAEVQKVIGADKVPLPGKDATPEDWDKVYAKLGRPAKPEEYDLNGFKPPAGMPWQDKVQAGMLGAMHKAGLNNRQVNELLTAYANNQATEWGDFQARQKQTHDAAEADLRTEWGLGYDQKLQTADKVWRWVLGEQHAGVAQIALADGSVLGNHPALIRAFAKVGEMVAERGALPDGARMPDFGVLTPDAAKREYNAMTTDQAKVAILRNKQHPEYGALNSRRLHLLEVINPQDQLVRRGE